MHTPDQPIAVIGAGSWGTALALQFARSGRAVRLWGRDAEQLAAIIDRCMQKDLDQRFTSGESVEGLFS